MKKNVVAVFEDTVPRQEGTHKNDWNGYEVSDGGQFLYFRFSDDARALYVDLRSSDEDSVPVAEKKHKVFKSLRGKKVRITVEVIE